MVKCITNHGGQKGITGQIVSVDQLESPMPAFTAQLKGNLTKQRYRYAAIFVDQYSCLSYVSYNEQL